MSFAGRLDGFDLTDVLQMLASSEKTGTVQLNQRYEEGLIVLRRGRILYAASSNSRQTLGSLLVGRGLVDEESLERALEDLMDGSRERRLGTILVEQGILDEEVLKSVIREQIEGVIREFLSWKGAYFRFEPMKIPDHGEVEVDAKDFLLRGGVATDQVLFDLLLPPKAHEAATRTLGSLMREIRPAEFTAEAIHRIRTSAREVSPRGLLLATGHSGYFSMAVWGESAQAIERDRPIASLSGSLLDGVRESRRLVRRQVGRDEKDPLWDRLGDPRPREVLAIPFVVNGRVLAITYCDDEGVGEIDDARDLELLLEELGLDLERRALERRMLHLQQRRRAAD